MDESQLHHNSTFIRLFIRFPDCTRFLTATGNACLMLYRTSVISAVCLFIAEDAIRSGLDGKCLVCSLVREIRRLRDQLMVDVAPDDIAAANDATQAAAQLSNLLLGVSGSVSLLNETLHESLLSQLLTIPLWSVPQVSVSVSACLAV
jgi:hypothetical protein